MALAAGAREIFAEPAPRDDDKPAGPPVNCAIIGLGTQGREILTSLAKMGNTSAPVVAICDTFNTPVFAKKSTDIVPGATFYDEYRKVLEQSSVQAVFIATPSHKHKQIALDALAAGKHVYCEAPLATDLAEAKAIAKAGLDAKTFFQPGLQVRNNKQHLHVLKFVRAGALGQIADGRAQWHERKSWRQAWPDQARMQELNWRLSKETSSGLVGEIGIHQIDTATWFFKALPLSVTGFGAIIQYNDGRDIPDTVQCVLEYPNNQRFVYDATLVSSFDGAYELFLGSKCAIMTRDQRAWMFKEADAEQLGWEVYARRDDLSIGDVAAGSGIKTASGIALVADATKQLAHGQQPGKVGTDVSKTALYQAIDAFLTSIRTNKKPEVGPLEGYQATVVARKAHEAVLSGSKITFEKEWFEI